MVVRALMVSLVLVSAAWGQHGISADELRKITKLLGTSPPLRIDRALSKGSFSDEVDSKHVDVPLERFGVRYNGNVPSAAEKILEDGGKVFEFNFGRGAINGPVISSDNSKSIISSFGRATHDGPVVTIHSKKEFSKNRNPKFHGKPHKTFSSAKKIRPGKLNFGGFKPIHGPRLIQHGVGGLVKDESFSLVKEPSFQHNGPEVEQEVFTHSEVSAPETIVTLDDGEDGSVSNKVDKDMDGTPDILYRGEIDKVLVTGEGAGPGTAAVRDLLESIDIPAPVEEDVLEDSPVNDVNVINDQEASFSENVLSFSNTRRTRSHPTNEPRKQLINQIRQKIVTASRGPSAARSFDNNNQHNSFSSPTRSFNSHHQHHSFSSQQDSLSSVSDIPNFLRGASIVRGTPFRVISDRKTSSNFVNSGSHQQVSSHNQQSQPSFAPVRTSSLFHDSQANNQHQFLHNQAQIQSPAPVQSHNFHSQSQSQSHNTQAKPTSAPKPPQVLTGRPTFVRQSSAVPTRTPVRTSSVNPTTKQNFQTFNNKKPVFVKQTQSKPTPVPVKVSTSAKPAQVIQPRRKATHTSKTSAPKIAAPKTSGVTVTSAGGSGGSSLPASLLQSLGGAQGPSVVSAGQGGSQIIVKTIELDASDADPSSDAFRKALEKATKEARAELGVADGEELGVGGPELAKLFGKRRRKRQLFGGEDQSTAQTLGGALSTGAGLFGSTLGIYLDTQLEATINFLRGLETISLLALDQIDAQLAGE